MFRHLILCLVLVSTSFAPSAALNRSSRADDVFAPAAFAQKPALDASDFDSNYKLALPQPVQDKNFYLLSLFQRNRKVRKLLSRNKPLRRLADEKLLALGKTASCNDVGCFDELLRFSGITIDAVAAELEALAQDPQFKALAKKDLRPSGVFIKYSRLADAQMVAAAWKDAANGLNRILSVYCLGNDPSYKNIDRVSFDVHKKDYSDLLRARIKEIRFSKESLFFEPTLNFALKLLEVNRRDEAGRYEPLAAGENKAALNNLRNIKWSDYQYSFILVLGAGPGDSARLSATGAKRADVAAQLFLQHKAPLIIMSGGHVHPMQTPYCEAIEMKKYVMEKYKIPETAILVEPHARHTTTNFRNSARLALRYHVPTDLKALVTSSADHIAYTASEEFRTRCVKEMGYFPVEFIMRVSGTEAEFKPAVASLFFDANDPLDP
ncbi:MAG: YdcF family protein [Acidobacteriota bacterium]